MCQSVMETGQLTGRDGKPPGAPLLLPGPHKKAGRAERVKDSTRPVAIADSCPVLHIPHLHLFFDRPPSQR